MDPRKDVKWRKGSDLDALDVSENSRCEDRLCGKIFQFHNSFYVSTTFTVATLIVVFPVSTTIMFFANYFFCCIGNRAGLLAAAFNFAVE